jgi:hypothetical protein
VGFEGVKISRSLFGRNLVADVQQLAKMGIVLRVLAVVTQRGHKLLRSPASYRIGAREFCPVDVDDRGVGGAELVYVRQRLGIDLPG